MTKRIVQWNSPDGRTVMASAESPGPGWTRHSQQTPPPEVQPTYPTFIRFDLTGSRRERVLDAADALGLKVTHQHGGTGFDVAIPTPSHAYQFGRRTKGKGLDPKADA